jgi:hypothetical protein
MDEGVQQQPGEARTVLPAGMQSTVLSEGAMGIVVHLQTTEIRKRQLSYRNQLRKLKLKFLTENEQQGKK